MESNPSALTRNLLGLARARPHRPLVGRLRLLRASREFLDAGEVTVLRLTDGASEGLFLPATARVQADLDAHPDAPLALQFRFLGPFFLIDRLLGHGIAKVDVRPDFPGHLDIQGQPDIQAQPGLQAQPTKVRPTPAQSLPARQLPPNTQNQPTVLLPPPITSPPDLLNAFHHQPVPVLPPSLPDRSLPTRPESRTDRLEALLEEWRGLTFGTPTVAVSGRVLGVSPVGPVRTTYCCWAVMSAGGVQRRVYFFGGQALEAQSRLWERGVFRLEGVVASRRPHGDEEVLLFGLGGRLTEVPPSWDRFCNVSQRDPACRAQPVHSLGGCRRGERVSVLGTVAAVRLGGRDARGRRTNDALHVTDAQHFCEVELRSVEAAELGAQPGDYLLLSGLRVEEPTGVAGVARLTFDGRSAARWNPFFAGCGEAEAVRETGTGEGTGSDSREGLESGEGQVGQAGQVGRGKRVKG